MGEYEIPSFVPPEEVPHGIARNGADSSQKTARAASVGQNFTEEEHDEAENFVRVRDDR